MLKLLAYVLLFPAQDSEAAWHSINQENEFLRLQVNKFENKFCFLFAIGLSESFPNRVLCISGYSKSGSNGWTSEETSLVP